MSRPRLERAAFEKCLARGVRNAEFRARKIAAEPASKQPTLSNFDDPPPPPIQQPQPRTTP